MSLSKIQSSMGLPNVEDEGAGSLLHTLEKQVTALLTDKIIEALGIKKTILVASNVVSLSSSIISFLTSLYIANQSNDVNKILLYVAPISNLIGIGSSISSLIIAAKLNIKFEMKYVHETVGKLLEKMAESDAENEQIVIEATSNAFTPSDYLKYGISFISLIIASAMLGYGFSVRDMNAWLSMREHLVKLKGDIHSQLTLFLDEVGLTDFAQNKSIFDSFQALSEKCSKVLKTQTSEFVINRSKYNQLQECIEEIKKLQLKKLSEEQTRAYSSFRSSLNSQYMKMIEINNTIGKIVDSTDRQTCLGFVLQGQPGVGKSEATLYILRKIAKALSYSSSIYEMKPGPSGNYFQIYSGQQLGIYNEFSALRDTEPIIAKINEIVSGDPCNLEAADLDFKHQPCRINVAGFTANKEPNDVFDFTRTMTEQSNLALMTRLIRIQVRDPEYKGRNELNLHRKSDFSHLRFSFIKTKKTGNQLTKLSDCAEIEEEPIDLSQLIGHLTMLVARNEVAFIRNKVLSRDDLSDAIKEGMETRLTQLEPFLNPIQSNASNTVPFVARIQGPTARGKTVTAMKIAQQLSFTYNMKIKVYDTDTFLKTPGWFKQPCIFVINDIRITKENETAWLNWVNSTPPNSCILYTTNDVIPPTPIPLFSSRHIFHTFLKVYDNLMNFFNIFWYYSFLKTFFTEREIVLDSTKCKFTDYEDTPGMWRRIGVQGTLRTKNEYYTSPIGNSLCVTLTNSGTMWIDTKEESLTDFTPHVADAYLQYLKTTKQLIYSNDKPPTMQPHVHITVRDFELYKQKVKTLQGYMDMYLNADDPAGQVIVRGDMKDTFLKRADVRTWIMPNITDEANFRRSMEPMIYRLRNAIPDVTISFTFLGQNMFYANGVCYTAAPVTAAIQFIDGYLYVNNKCVKASDLASFYCRGIAALDSETIASLNGEELHVAKSYLEKNINDPNYVVYAAALKAEIELIEKQERLKESHPITLWLRTHKREVVICSAILGGLATICSLYLVYKWFSKKSKKVVQFDSNGVSPGHKIDRNVYNKLSEAYYNGVMQNKYKQPRDYVQELIRSNVGADLAKGWQQEYEWNRSNAVMPVSFMKFVDAYNNHDYDTAQVYFNQYAQEKGTVTFKDFINFVEQRKSNAVNKEDLHDKSKSLIDEAYAKLRRATCQVHSDRINYGLLLKDNYLITVAHSIDPKANNYIVWSPDESKHSRMYSCEVVVVNSKKDLAILRVTDKTFPMAPSILNMLPDSDMCDDWSESVYFLRTVPDGGVFQGRATYIARRSFPLYDSTNPKFKPTSYITYEGIDVANMWDVHRKGDCGLPIVSIRFNKVYIVGIHNSVSRVGSACYSPLFFSEIYHNTFNATKSNAIEPIPVDKSCVLHEFQGSLAIPNYNPYFDSLKPTDLWENHPDIPVLGYHHNLNFLSKPKFNKVKARSDKCIMDVDTKPSPTVSADLTPQAREFLCKDNRGKPSVLLTQTKKMFTGKPFVMNPEYMGMARRIHDDVFQVHYSKIRMLRMHEAINGVYNEALNKLDFSTSCGPYIKLVYKLTDKTKLFKNHNEGTNKPPVYGFTDHPAATALAIDTVGICDAWRGNRSVVICIKDNPKVELLPAEEVDNEGKCRLFCEMDLSVNLALRVFLGDFLNQQNLSHNLASAKIGLNPYTFPQSFMRHVTDNWKTIATDIKRLDKNFPLELLIEYFAAVMKLTTSDTHKRALLAIAISFSKTIHFQNGVVYMQIGGNPSGVFFTTSINSFLGERYVIYHYVKQVHTKALYSHLSVSNFLSKVRQATLGDDSLIIYDPELDYDFEGLRQTFEEGGLDLVEAKNFSGKTREFCSREIYFDNKNCIWVSRLKKTSVLQCIYYVDIKHKEVIPLSFSTALFEASFWDEKFFDNVKHDIICQCKFLNIDITSVRLFDYKAQRYHFAQYVRGFEKSPVITGLGPAEIYYLNLSNKDFYNPNEIMNNYVGQYLEKCAKTKSPCAPREVEVRQDKLSLEWSYTVSDEGHTGTGTGNTKSTAKQRAYEELLNHRFGYEVVSNALVEQSRVHKHSIRYTINSYDNNTLHNVGLSTDNNMVLTPTFQGSSTQVQEYMSEYFRTHHNDIMLSSVTQFLADKLIVSNSMTSDDSCDEVDSDDSATTERSIQSMFFPNPHRIHNATYRFAKNVIFRHSLIAKRLYDGVDFDKMFVLIKPMEGPEYLDNTIDEYLTHFKPEVYDGIRYLRWGRTIIFDGKLNELPTRFVRSHYFPQPEIHHFGLCFYKTECTTSSTLYIDKIPSYLDLNSEEFEFTDPNIESDK